MGQKVNPHGLRVGIIKTMKCMKEVAAKDEIVQIHNRTRKGSNKDIPEFERIRKDLNQCRHAPL